MSRSGALFIALLLVLGASVAEAADDIVIADFEGPNYGDWKVEGAAFGTGPAHGTLPGQMDVSGFLGKGLANSFVGGDGPVGTLTSPSFRIERKLICFLIGGGGYPEQTCINLRVDGKVLRSATGPNRAPGGSERLAGQTWDVSELKGKMAAIEIVDRNSGGWGHINVDHIIQADAPLVAEGTMDISVSLPYLSLPVKTGAPMRRMRLMQGEKIFREFDVELSETPDFYMAADVSDVLGQTIRVWVDTLERGSKVLSKIQPIATLPGTKEAYGEAYRPQFHFSPLRGWNNDPNGLVFYQGEYHLYFQHNPYGRNWGNMHWAHAVSPDLIHWRQLPIAIYPHAYGDWVFSGSAVVDANNTAGFQTGTTPPLVAAYTSTGRGEAIVYSNDGGRSFTEYEGNPAVKHQGRDPRLLWYAPGQHWVMAVYDEIEKGRYVAFYTSPDLKQWTFQSRIEGYFECPELFELPVDGKEKHSKWILYAADGAYAIGAFDGKTFTPDGPKQRYNYGDCFYASQTFSAMPDGDKRRVQIAWGQTGQADMPFNQMMNFPVELTLRKTGDGPHLFANPVQEIEKLHREGHTWKRLHLKPGINPLSEVHGELIHIRLRFSPGDAEEVGLNIRGTKVSYDVRANALTCNGKTASLRPEHGDITVELLADRLSLEIFANDGLVYMPMQAHPDPADQNMELYSKNGDAKIKLLEVFDLDSIWTTGGSASVER